MDEQKAFKKLSIHEIETALGEGLSRATNTEITTELKLLNLDAEGNARAGVYGTNTYEATVTIHVPMDYSETMGWLDDSYGQDENIEGNHGFDK